MQFSYILSLKDPALSFIVWMEIEQLSKRSMSGGESGNVYDSIVEQMLMVDAFEILFYAIDIIKNDT